MVRNVDYASRRKAVLTATINRYIGDASPVASEHIAADFDLSSATIRNIFAELEEDGFLTHPYTSGGRVPTEKGYRYYVDFLTAQIELLDEEKKRIVANYKKELRRLEDALEETSEIISQVTHYASIVSLLEWQDRFFYKGIGYVLEQPEFQNLDKIRLLIKMVEDKRKLLDVINREFDEKVRVYIGKELGCPEMENCSLVVSRYNFKNRPLGRLAVLGPVRMQYSYIIPTIEYISEVLTEVLNSNIT
jgi:heat-inducible transcriptional repressor